MNLKSSVIICVAGILVSCSSNTQKQNNLVPLCQRNVFSRNGVSVSRMYSYKAKEGELDLSSKTLYATCKYDSLGNLVYYKGKNTLTILAYNQIKAIEDALYSKPNRESITYKMEYKDTNLIKVVLFDEKGDYFARIECKKDKYHREDSVYVNNRLVHVRKSIFDVNGRDSLCLEYEGKSWGDVELSEQKEYSYSLLEDGTIRQTVVFYSKGYDYSSKKKFDKTTTVSDSKYDDKGRLIFLSTDDRITQSIVYDESGLNYENVFESKYGTNKRVGLYKTECFENGLIKSQTTYQDKTILTEKTEYEYEFYPYSPWSNCY